MSTTQQAVEELSIRGVYTRQRLASYPITREGLQGPGENLAAGRDSTEDSEMTKPPRPAQPAPNGHEIPVPKEPELPTSTSADVMESTGMDEGNRRSQWDWLQGVFSSGKKGEDTAEAVPTDEEEHQDKPDKENIVGVQAPIAGMVSKDAPAAAAPPMEVQKEKARGVDSALLSEAKEASETVAGVVGKMPRADSEESKEAKAMPGVWIKPVWGSRQEVDDLDLAIQQALELEQIDCSKYFTKDYTEFASVAHYYVYINDLLDEEEVDLLASFAGRMGDDHPLVAAMMEIMEEDGTHDGSILMEPEPSDQQLKTKSAEIGVYITGSGRLKDASDIHRDPASFGQGAAVRVSTQRSLAATSDDTTITTKTTDIVNNGESEQVGSSAAPVKPPRARKTGDDDHSDMKGPRPAKLPQPLVPGMDEMIGELSGLSWLSRRGPLKPRDDLSTKKALQPDRKQVPTAARHTVGPGPLRPPTETQVPPQRPSAKQGPSPQRPAGLHTDRIATRDHHARNHRGMHDARPPPESSSSHRPPKRGLLDIVCCLKPRVENE